MASDKVFRWTLPLALTLGGMITLGVITTTLGFMLWPEPKSHHDTSTEGWLDGRKNWVPPVLRDAGAVAPVDRHNQ